MTIYFATILLGEEIHTIPGGFADMLHKYVDAQTPEAAIAAAESWVDARGIAIKRVTVTPALKQARNSYAFPEHIISAAECGCD